MSNTSWQKVSKWYQKSVGQDGNYFHKNIILPKLLKILDLKNDSKLLDLGCGQGVLCSNIENLEEYVGVDLSSDLIKFAERNNSHKKFRKKFFVADASKPLNLNKDYFTHVTIILALQNIENFQKVFENANAHLKIDGKFFIIINHPYFRIPRQTSWQIDEKRKIQYRRIDHYLSPLKIPINMTPGDKNSKLTWSFHNSLHDYSLALKEARFKILEIQEWISDKKSQGPAAKMEDRARNEIPMFMAIIAEKY